MKEPLISIIVPCYNQAQYLSEALQSVLDQTYTNWECIIVNDGSPDNTEEIALEWIKKNTKFNYLKKQNGGLSSARNEGIKIAKGEWILPLDADDYISTNYLELASKEFNKKNIKLIYGNAEKFGEETGFWSLPDYSIEILAHKNVIYCTAFFKRKDWETIGGYDEKMIYGLEDWDFWISLLESGGEVHKINQICFYYRIKNNSMVRSISEEKKEFLYTYLANKHTRFFIKHIGNFHKLNSEIEKYKNNYLKIYNSKRYKIGNKIVSIFDFLLRK